MKSFDVVSADDPRVCIQFPVGDIVITVPRFDFIDEDTLDEVEAASEGIDPDLPGHRRQKQLMLTQFKPFCTPQEYAVLEGLKLGQLTFMLDTWTKNSAMPLGEFLASDDSSTENTGRRSGRTSSGRGSGA